MKTTSDKIFQEVIDFIRANPKYRYVSSHLTSYRVLLEQWESETSGDTKLLDRYFSKNTAGRFVIVPLNKYLDA